MRRREFIGFFGGAAAWPLRARGQQSDRVRRIGVLLAVSQSDPEVSGPLAAVRRRLEELGWVEGRNIRFDYRFLAGDTKRISSVAAELVSLAPDVILTQSSQIVSALQQETRTIPIVFAQASDPLSTGLVKDLGRPGGNTTGFMVFQPAMGGKWLELLKEISPRISQLMLVKHPDNPSTDGYMKAIEPLAASLSVQVRMSRARDGSEIVRAIEALAQERNAGLIVLPDPINFVHRSAIIEVALRHQIPAVYPFRYFAEDGGLAAYGVELRDLYLRAAGYIDRILRGENPGDLPVQAPTKFELVINLKTARALGLEISPMLLARADEVIE